MSPGTGGGFKNPRRGPRGIVAVTRLEEDLGLMIGEKDRRTTGNLKIHFTKTLSIARIKGSMELRVIKIVRRREKNNFSERGPEASIFDSRKKLYEVTRSREIERERSRRESCFPFYFRFRFIALDTRSCRSGMSSRSGGSRPSVRYGQYTK